MCLKLSLLDLSGSDPDTLGLCGLEFPVLGCSNRAWFLWTASECTFHALSCDCMPAFGRRARDAKALSGLLVQQAFHRVRLRGTISSFLRCEMAFTFFSCSHVCVCAQLCPQGWYNTRLALLQFPSTSCSGAFGACNAILLICSPAHSFFLK